MNIAKTICCTLLLVSVCGGECRAQLPDGFKTMEVNRKVGSFELDSINLSTPVDYYLSRAWVRSTGKERHWADISSSMFVHDADAPDVPVDGEMREYILDENIDAVVTYRDSSAAVLTHSEGEGLVMLNYCWIEEGRWVNGGQGIADNMDDAWKILAGKLPANYAALPRIAEIGRVPEDVAPFVSFLSGVQASPEEFLMDVLSSCKLVVCGEYHRRKVSWDMLRRLVAMPQFPENVGHVFMELPSWCQPCMDEFLAADTLDTEAVLDIFREEQPIGWWDRGEYEFICDVWRLNRTLPSHKRIRIVLADYQIPYSGMTVREDARELEDRNTHMADVIEETIRSSRDRRNCLFVVGCGHAYRSHVPGHASAAYRRTAEMSAAAQLVDRLGKENVFTVFQHALPGDNDGNNRVPLRGGMFDLAFEACGNRPVGFRLDGSPFGDEPFDGIYEIRFNPVTGTYSDNFDGYLFLHPVADEPRDEPLTEIFTDEFVAEIKRRAAVLGTGRIPSAWFGRKADELTREYIISVL